MRTTVDLPDDLLRQAKIFAVTNGTTLKELISSALAKELHVPSQEPVELHARFPIFNSLQPGALHITDEAIRTVGAEDDLRQSGLAV